MTTGLGVEIPRRVRVVGAVALAPIVTGALLGGVTTGGRIPVDVGAPVAAVLLSLVSGGGHGANALIIVCVSVTFIVHARSAYLRRRREQRERAGTVEVEVTG